MGKEVGNAIANVLPKLDLLLLQKKHGSECLNDRVAPKQLHIA